MQDRFREHISVADVLKANYGSTDDIERVEAIHALENEIQQLCCSREADVQATLRGTCPPSCSVVYSRPPRLQAVSTYMQTIGLSESLKQEGAG